MRNFIFTILTVSLIGLLMFLYQQNLKTNWELADITTTTTKVIDERLTVVQEGMKQISEAWGDIQTTTQLSNLIKNNKQSISLKTDNGFYVYNDAKIGFEVKLPVNIFTNNIDDNLMFTDDQVSILSFGGKYKNYPIHIAMLISQDNQSCGEIRDLNVKINDIDFKCETETFDQKLSEYHKNCYIEKNDWCFVIEYNVSDYKEKSLLPELDMADVLLKNISFIESN